MSGLMITDAPQFDLLVFNSSKPSSVLAQCDGIDATLCLSTTENVALERSEDNAIVGVTRSHIVLPENDGGHRGRDVEDFLDLGSS